MRMGSVVFTIWLAIVFDLFPGPVWAEVKAYGLSLLWSHDLGDVSFHVRGGHTPDTFLSFSNNGRFLALGTLEGDLLVFESRSGQVVLKRKIPEAMVKKLAFSPEDDVLYYGEQGPEGSVCALSFPGGQEKWCFSTARDLGRGEPPPPGDLYAIYHQPGIYRLEVLKGGDLLVLANHSWYDSRRRIWRRLSRLYRLNPEGRLRWAYPRKGPAPLTMIYADADAAGKRIGVMALLPSEDPEDLRLFGPRPQSFLLLDGRDGSLLWQYSIEPLKPYFDRVSAWESVSLSPEGRLAGVGTSDGRLFLFDLEEKKAKVLSLATPILIGGFPVSATLSFGLFGPDGRFYVITGESTLPFALPLLVDRPAGPHPAARSLFAVEPEGTISWRFHSPFRLQGLAVSRNGRVLAVGSAAFRKEGFRVKQFGVLVFRLWGEGGGLSRLLGYFPTAGICFFHLAVSPEGDLVAAVETPWRDEWGRIHGKYRLILLKVMPVGEAEP